MSTLVVLVVLLPTIQVGLAQQPPSQLGTYAELDARRRQLVDDWIDRVEKTTGRPIEAGPFYDHVLSISAKTTFDAVTHALLTTTLTDRSGGSHGDALALVARVEALRGEVTGEPGDRQFRMYVQLVDGAVDRLELSQQFKRGTDNTVYHRGYPINYRAQGGVPSIQILDRVGPEACRRRRRLSEVGLPHRTVQRPFDGRQLGRARGKQL